MDMLELNAINGRAQDTRSSHCRRPVFEEVAVLSKHFPYYGYVEVEVTGAKPFVMLSNNDDFVAKRYFWGGKDAYEGTSLALWTTMARTAPFILDVGSYTGVYSLAAASANQKGKVFAFEPLDRNYLRLLLNRGVNQFANINAVNKAVADSEGSLHLNVYAGDAVLVSGSSLVEQENVDAVEKRLVGTVQLDTFLRDKPARIGQMKIDVEGAEHLVLAGAREVIRRDMPDLFVELLPTARIQSLSEFFDGLGYNYFGIDDGAGDLRKVEVLSARGDMDTVNLDALNTLITRRSAEQLAALGFRVIA